MCAESIKLTEGSVAGKGECLRRTTCPHIMIASEHYLNDKVAAAEMSRWAQTGHPQDT